MGEPAPGLRRARTVLRLAVLLLVVLAAGCRPAPAGVAAGPATGADRSDPFALVAEADRLAARDLWPGFDLQAVPLAIYDGTRTLLFRHPAPPDGFDPVPERVGVLAHAGRHPSIVANTSIELNGVLTATAMPGVLAAPLREGAGLIIHEAFHVFQRRRHPAWSANEVELFTYPADDAALLALRRLETEALRRALAGRATEATACWAREAVARRAERFARLSAGAAAYERLSELNEGLATYVEQRATGVDDGDVVAASDFPPDAVRQRAYTSGAGLARLLDRLEPGWRAELARNDTVPLDVLLSRALAARQPPGGACAFSGPEQDSVRAVAARDVESLRGQRAERRGAYLAQAGWRLVVSAPAAPLFPEGFDPLNVQVVGTGEVLHTRFLRLGNDAGTVEVLGRGALTEAAGAHPLFNGVRTLTLTGLAEAPSIAEQDGAITLQADGIRVQLRGATVEHGDSLVTVRLPGGSR